METFRDGAAIRIDSFEGRLGLLVTLAVVVALGELVFLGRRARRWREYLFIAAAGLFGALLGMLVDSLTSRISPAYFVIGKGLEGGPGLHVRASLLGARAGFIAGAVMAGALLVAAGPAARVGDGGTRRLGRTCFSIGACSLIGALVIGVVGGSAHLHPALLPGFENAPAFKDPRFVAVWWTHLGVYVGCLARGGVGIAQAWRWRMAVVGHAT